MEKEKAAEDAYTCEELLNDIIRHARIAPIEIVRAIKGAEKIDGRVESSGRIIWEEAKQRTFDCPSSIRYLAFSKHNCFVISCDDARLGKISVYKDPRVYPSEEE